MTKTNRKILLRSCPRCRGDLFPDEEDFACLSAAAGSTLASSSPS